MSEQMNHLLDYLPVIGKLFPDTFSDVEEIRLIRGRNIRLCKEHSEQELPYFVDESLIQDVMDRSTHRSPHGVMEMLRKGFLILPGGHRLGLCGTGVYKEGSLRSLRDISSINIRVARDIVGIGTSIANTLWSSGSSALCMGPPGRGKTTLLRDVIRQLSTRYRERICVIDERQELAASLEGIPQFDLGPTSDIMSSVKKSDAIDMTIRTMGPTWVALDEITAEEDVEAMIRGSYCGVKFIATAHGHGLRDLNARPVYRKLMENGIFDHLFVLNADRSLHKEVLWKSSVS